MGGQGRYLLRAGLFLLAAAAALAPLREVILRAFLHNPALNALILAAALLGVGYNIRRILALRPGRRWVLGFSAAGSAGMPPPVARPAPPVLAPIAAALAGGPGRPRARPGAGNGPPAALPAASVRHLLDSVGSRLDESRDIARYLTGLLIFLGLLGTFWGLLEAINSVGGVIANLSLGGGDPVALFEEMKAGLTRPLTGMGTAFSASLFGLAGSLILGFLDLQASQAQNAFANDLEEWLTGMARLDLGGAEGVGVAAALPVYVQAMLERTADNLDRLEAAMARGEAGQERLREALAGLADGSAGLLERLARDGDAVARLADAQVLVADRLDRPALDEATREHIRNSDASLARLVEELRRERGDLTREVRLVARAIAIAAGEPPPAAIEPAAAAAGGPAARA